MAYTFKIVSDTTGAVTGLKNIRRQMQGMHSDINKTQNSLGDLERHLRRIGEYMVMRFAVHGLVEMGKGVLDTTAKWESLTNVIKYSSLNSKDAADNMKFINDVAKRLHLPLMETAQGFSDMQAGMVGTGIEGEKMRKIFEALSTANSVLHLNPNTMSRIFYDVKVMAEMTNVQKREIGRMLARVLPGTMKIAANASDTDIEGFLEKMKAGLVKSKDFLPKFAEGIQKYYVAGLRNSTKSIVANMNDVSTAISNIQLQLGTKLKGVMLEIMQTIIRLGQKFADWLDTSGGQKLIQTLYDIWNGLKLVYHILAFMWPVLKYIIELFLIWKALSFLDKWTTGLINIYNNLNNIFYGATTVSSAFQSWILPLALSVGLIALLADQINNVVTMAMNKDWVAQKNNEIEDANDKIKVRNEFKEAAKKRGDTNRVKELNSQIIELTAKRNLAQEALSNYEAKSDPIGGIGMRMKEWLGLDKIFPKIPKMGESGVIEHPNLDSKGGGGTNTDAAINASNLSGASGGLGQAKVLNLYFSKALIENNIPGGDGKDIINTSQQAAELLIRICNNIASPQGAIM